jgi:hypothetical protein
LAATLTKNKSYGFERLTADDCVFRRRGKKLGDRGYVALGSHVDDLFCIGDEEGFKALDNILGKDFKVKSEDDPAIITGVQLIHDHKNGYAKLHMAGYIEGLLEKTGMVGCKIQFIPLDPGIPKGDLPVRGSPAADGPEALQLFQSMFGMLLWLAIRVRPDILFAVSFLGRFVSNAGNKQIEWARGIIRYLAGTKTLGLGYQRTKEKAVLQGASDADFAGCTRTSRSTSAIYFGYGPLRDLEVLGTPRVGCIIASQHLERKIATSTGQSETHAAHDAVEEIVWLRHLAEELGDVIDYPILLRNDNSGVVKQSTKPINHTSAKHYRVAQAFIRAECNNGHVRIGQVNTKDNVPDILTKALDRIQFCKLRINLMGPQEPLSE